MAYSPVPYLETLDKSLPYWAEVHQKALEQQSPDLQNNLHQSAIAAWQELQLEIPKRMVDALGVAAALGGVETYLPFHNSLHHFKVLLRLRALLTAHGKMHLQFEENHTALLIIAACVHDFAHDGNNNWVDDILVQGRMEQQSFDLVKPYFAGLLDEKELALLEVLILSTDVGSDKNCRSLARQVVDKYVSDEPFDSERLGVLNDDPEYVEMAVYLHEADLATSAGLDYATTQEETALFYEEAHGRVHSDADIVEFLQGICADAFYSEAGKKMFQDNKAKILERAKSSIA